MRRHAQVSAATRGAPDREAVALGKVERLLRPLTDQAKARVLRYFAARYEVTWPCAECGDPRETGP